MDVCIYEIASLQHRSTDHYENWHVYMYFYGEGFCVILLVADHATAYQLLKRSINREVANSWFVGCHVYGNGKLFPYKIKGPIDHIGNVQIVVRIWIVLRTVTNPLQDCQNGRSGEQVARGQLCVRAIPTVGSCSIWRE
ncbi:hypothetical protein TNCV_1527641 [Trichonephila clavipes]|nr:hypothetical protein TNCV_1527641 [Trichonephila clavipes]